MPYRKWVGAQLVALYAREHNVPIEINGETPQVRKTLRQYFQHVGVPTIGSDKPLQVIVRWWRNDLYTVDPAWTTASRWSTE